MGDFPTREQIVASLPESLRDLNRQLVPVPIAVDSELPGQRSQSGVSDGTFFYNRTVYSRLATPVPDCFLRLDSHIGAQGLSVSDEFGHPAVTLAENLCPRMGDVDFQAEHIESSLSDGTGAYAQAVVVGTLLVAHFGACKSVLDAAAVSLNQVFGLGLQGGNCDLRKPVFWNTLKARESLAAARYDGCSALVTDIVDWRDAAVHRVAPLTVASGKGEPQDVPLPSYTVALCLVRDIDNRGLVQLLKGGPRPDKFGHPLHFHRLWRDEVVELCGQVCDDIATIV